MLRKRGWCGWTSGGAWCIYNMYIKERRPCPRRVGLRHMARYPHEVTRPGDRETESQISKVYSDIPEVPWRPTTYVWTGISIQIRLHTSAYLTREAWQIYLHPPCWGGGGLGTNIVRSQFIVCIVDVAEPVQLKNGVGLWGKI